MVRAISANSHSSLSDKVQWIKKHTPSLSTVGIVALKAIALVGVAIFSIYFPVTSIVLSVSAFVAYRIFMEYSQYKFDLYFNNQTHIGTETYAGEHARMLQAVKVMQTIATNRHLAQVVSLAAIVSFWRIKAPLLILGMGVAAVTFAVDYFDTRSNLKKLEKQVCARIYNSPAFNAWEQRMLQTAYPTDDVVQIQQKCIIERDCRRLRMEYQEKADHYTAQAYTYMLRSGRYSVDQGLEDASIILPLGQLSVIFELESDDDNSGFRRSPLLRHHLALMDDAKADYILLTKAQKERLRQRIINSEGYTAGDALEERVFQKVCERWRSNPQAASFCEGAEKFHLRRLRFDLYLKSVLVNRLNLLFRPGEPRNFN